MTDTTHKIKTLPLGKTYFNDSKKLAGTFKGWGARKTGIAIEIAGPPSFGKTHIACTAPNPALGSTEVKGWRVAHKLGLERYVNLHRWEDLLAFVYYSIESDEVESIIIDSSKDMVAYAEAYYIEQGGKKFEKNVWYSNVYSQVKDIIHDVRMSGKNLIFTSKMKDKYLNGEKVSHLTEPSGFNDFWYQADGRVILQKGFVFDGKPYFKDQVVGRIDKNALNPMGKYIPWVLPGEDGLTFDRIVTTLSTRVEDPKQELMNLLK